MTDLKTDLAACVEALEPCPFCGDSPVGPVQIAERVWKVSCASRLRHDAHAMSWESADDAIAAWNRRAPAIAELQARCEAYNAINLGWIAHVLDWYAGNAPDSLHAASAAKQARLVRAAIDASREAGEAGSA